MSVMVAFFLFLLFIFVVIVFIILLNLKSSIFQNHQLLLKRIEKLSSQLSEIRPEGIKEKPAELIADKKIAEPILPDAKEILVQKTQFVEEKKAESIQVNISETQYSQQLLVNKTQKIEKSIQKTDFEKFIGENLLNKIGIVLLVLAMIFFGKYAVDEGWLNETAKVLAIIVIGGVLIGIAHRLRLNYKAFSSVLAGGGIAALYIAIAIGFQLYGLFSQTSAFLILVVITIFAVLLSLAYNKMELAVIAIFGGFATPLMVSTGQSNYKILFTYILILDIGMLILAYFKKWNLVNFVANIATVILFGAWLGKEIMDGNQIPHSGALVFVSAFYLTFFLMNVINNIKLNEKFTAFEFIMLISNSFLYYWAGMLVIQDLNPNYMGLYTISLAVFNFAFAFPLYMRHQIDRNLVFLLIGLVLTFASIAIPVQFEGNYITLFWAAEMVLLLWLGQQSGIKLMKLAAFAVTFLMVISLIMDWEQIYSYKHLNNEVLTPIFNKGFITGMVSVVALTVAIWLIKRDTIILISDSIDKKLFSGIYLVFLIIGLYLVLLLELAYQIDVFYNNSKLEFIALSCFNYSYLLVVLVWASVKKIRFILHGLTAVSVFALIMYVFVVAPHFKQSLVSYLIGETNTTFAFLHLVSAIAALAICYKLWNNVKQIYNAPTVVQNISTWVTIVIGLVILSFELDYAVVLINKPEFHNLSSILRQTHLIGWPILWGIIAFSLMFAGIKADLKIFRIIGLTVFFFALAKFFVFDIWDMPAGGRIIAGASLAVLLLVISFLYQKLKRLILEGGSAEIESNTTIQS
jgi:uncharacterized membrane protein